MGTSKIKNKKNPGLTPIQQLFLDEMLNDPKMLPTQAAKKAGYKNPAVAATGLMKRKDIQKALSRQLNARAKRCEISQDDILQELVRIGFSSFKKYIDEQGEWIPIHSWADEDARLVAEIDYDDVKEQNEEGKWVVVRQKIKHIRFWPKMNALELAGKHLGMWSKELAPQTPINVELLQGLVSLINAAKGQPQALPYNTVNNVGNGGSTAALPSPSPNVIGDDFIEGKLKEGKK